MATISQTATTLTSPTYAWGNSLSAQAESALHDDQITPDGQDIYPSRRPPLTPQSGNSTMHSSHLRRYSNGETGSDLQPAGPEGAVSPQHSHKEPKPRSVKDHTGPVESSLDSHGSAKGDRAEDSHKKEPGGLLSGSDSDENSKWIHRDKLARIENEELQAAGILLPRQRDRARSKSQNRPKRDQSQDKISGSGRSIGSADQPTTRSRKNSVATSVELKTTEITPIPSWDLRRPEEILEEGDGYWVSSGSGKGSSRIPVAKVSPAPIPNGHIARDTRLARKRDASPGEEDTITYPKTRQRSGSSEQRATPQPNKRTDTSPKKATTAPGTRRPKPPNGASGRPKTRGGPSKDSTGSGTTRPSTRSGEREFSANSRQMEGEPPWMVSAYRPDPRLPPDQQLLPTVAKRLQQEKWEKEGKFGNVYDKDFRPLTDEGFLNPPEPGTVPDKEEEKEPQEGEHQEWPLKDDSKPSLPGRTNSYSTMPKISDKPADPLPSPMSPQQTHSTPTVRVPDPPEESSEKRGGCGCCMVM
ncbi:hypothetical protein MMYC01_210555 [Madurella mycetomatis]|uniref:TeaA receptor TeaR n=1 Tax=Madurella mycetomatis TaxID=100816 RepID=A0A175VNE0_9PEZI|nr:hypothetical protein MMYC01_210555 [Madurella mycetomatis]